MNLDNELTYDKKRVTEYKLLDKETQKVLEWIGTSKQVLELGCHTGFLSEWLKKNQCQVTGVDINAKALDVASYYLHYSIHENIENESLWEKLQGKKFDVITWMHVLEHLSNPWKILKKSTEFIHNDGEIIIALPNICNAKERFNIFFGDFNYEKQGVMDITHMRFFNLITAQELIKQAGLTIIDYYSPWQVNPFYYFIDHFPIICKIRNIWCTNKVPFIFKNHQNLTDVVMMFRCKLR